MVTVDATAQPRGRPLVEIIDRESRRRRRRRVVRWSLLALVPVVAIVAALSLRPRPVPLSARFRDQAVEIGDLDREVRATGRVEAVTTVRVGAEISGRIASVKADFNDHVKQGQVLARFDTSVLDAQLAQGRAAQATAAAALEQARTDRDHTDRARQRAERLWAQAALPEADVEGARTAAQLARQRVRAAASQLAAQRAANELLRTNLGNAVIRSPIEGIVITREVDPGQTLASVLQAPVLFTVAADLRQMRVVAAVDEADIGHVQAGQHATFTVTAHPDRTFTGVVTEVRNAPVVVQNVVTYAAVVEVANDDLALKPGMTASARIRTASAREALLVPDIALHFTPPGRDEPTTAAVWLIDGERLRSVAVQTGISDGQWTVVAPGAVEEGTRVLVELTPEGRAAHGIGE